MSRLVVLKPKKMIGRPRQLKHMACMACIYMACMAWNLTSIPRRDTVEWLTNCHGWVTGPDDPSKAIGERLDESKLSILSIRPTRLFRHAAFQHWWAQFCRDRSLMKLFFFRHGPPQPHATKRTAQFCICVPTKPSGVVGCRDACYCFVCILGSLFIWCPGDVLAESTGVRKAMRLRWFKV